MAVYIPGHLQGVEMRSVVAHATPYLSVYTFVKDFLVPLNTFLCVFHW